MEQQIAEIVLRGDKMRSCYGEIVLIVFKPALPVISLSQREIRNCPQYLTQVISNFVNVTKSLKNVLAL